MFTDTDKETVLRGTIEKETDKALLFKFISPIDGEYEEEWFPLSQIAIDNSEDTYTNILVPNWILQKKGYI